jgi:hypothetical protein
MKALRSCHMTSISQTQKENRPASSTQPVAVSTLTAVNSSLSFPHQPKTRYRSVAPSWKMANAGVVGQSMARARFISAKRGR